MFQALLRYMVCSLNLENIPITVSRAEERDSSIIPIFINSFTIIAGKMKIVNTLCKTN